MKSDKENSMVTYFKGVRAEWGKLTKPEFRQVSIELTVVLFVVFVFTVAVFVMDKIFQWVLGLIH